MKNRKGAAVLVSVILIAAVILTIALSLGISSISENQINLYQSKSSRLFLNLDGCGEEAVTRLNRNNSYSGETLVVEDTSCIISVIGSGVTRTISIVATNDIYTKSLQINVTIFPTFTITSWDEITS